MLLRSLVAVVFVRRGGWRRWFDFRLVEVIYRYIDKGLAVVFVRRGGWRRWFDFKVGGSHFTDVLTKGWIHV